MTRAAKAHRWDQVNDYSTPEFFDALAEGLIWNALFLKAKHENPEVNAKISKLFGKFGLTKIANEFDERLEAETFLKNVNAKLGMTQYSFFSQLSQTVEPDELIGLAFLFKCELTNIDVAKSLATAELTFPPSKEFTSVIFNKVDDDWKFDGPPNKDRFTSYRSRKYRRWENEVHLRALAIQREKTKAK